ncbi:GNAT family N-acetyltransferase [Oscillatoria sp. CS-180]|uniref:GNAT family N-acetyltransferase n=1 Tax=Oscillatoria sp. CS-180 TaxID=3021720 RepID=UPI00232C2E6C|nr:GNAT family N-acetyltransferase [Oscillatoria sp. CS-180]MDB9525616.1 GNAT family N-acetyltransferase [Oscillatoria sp. CS-180]
MDIRIATAADLPGLATLFQAAVVQIGPQRYSAAQIQAWAASQADSDRFQQFILGVTTYIAYEGAEILGFAGIRSDGYVASLYVHPAYARQGIGSTLMQQVLEYARRQQISRLYTEASEFSKGLFAKFEFQLYDTEVVERVGVQFTRYLMEKTDLPIEAVR